MSTKPACMAVAALALGAGPAGAQPVDSAYSGTGPRDCRVLGTGIEHEERNCRGVAGVPVRLIYGDIRMKVSYGRRADAEFAAREGFGAPNAVGDRIEWRGLRTARGFRPFATILRWRLTDAATDKAAAVLVVTRLGPGGVCHVAYVDGTANPDANALARRAADDKARSFRCGEDRPEVVGRPGGGTDLAVRTRTVDR